MKKITKILKVLIINFSIMIICSFNCLLVSANSDNLNEEDLSNNNYETSTTSLANKTDNIIDLNSVNDSLITNKIYIPNYKYFYANPKHAENSKSDYSMGTCTTVAMQLLMGYYNYYIDGRLIPEYKVNTNIKFLSENYRNLQDYPEINDIIGIGLGKDSLGTEDTVYRELLDLNTELDLNYIGQNIFSVANAANKFVEENSLAISSNVSIIAKLYNEEEVNSDLSQGKPVILGFLPNFTDANTWHVVVAYGMATYNGEEGYVIHCGWDEDDTYCWIPADWIGFQIRMNINHTHTYVDGNTNINNMYRRKVCTECGCEILDDLYNVSEIINGSLITNKINNPKYPLAGEIQIFNEINGVSLTTIGDEAFKNQTGITSITIPTSVTSIGSSAFEGCIGLNKVYYEGTIEDWSNIRFENAYSNPMYYAEEFYILNSNNTYQEVTNITIPNSITAIGDYQFYGFDNLISITLSSSIISINETVFGGCNKLNKLYYNGTIEDWCDLTFTNKNQNPMSYIEEFYILNSNNTYQEVTNITIPNTITAIGDYQFFGFDNLISITLPSSVTSIKETSFENCYRLNKLYYNGSISNWCNITFTNKKQNPMYYIEEFYMLDSNNTYQEVTNITIPNTVTRIGDYQFYGFDNLTKATILKEYNGITILGVDAFDECNLLTEINVPLSRYITYKTSTNWNEYTSKLTSDETYDVITLTDGTNASRQLEFNHGYLNVLKLNVQRDLYYYILPDTSSNVKITLYNSNMTYLTTEYESLTFGLTVGTYYVEFEIFDETESQTVTIHFEDTSPQPQGDMLYDQVNNITNMIYLTNSISKKAKIRYNNNQGVGFFKFSFNLYNSNEELVSLSPESFVMFYTPSDNMPMIKYELPNWEHYALNIPSTDSITVYLPRNGYFYIEIALPNIDILELTVLIEDVEYIEDTDLTDLNTNTFIIFDENQNGDNIKKLVVEETGTYYINTIYEGTDNETFPVIIVKQTTNSSVLVYSLMVNGTINNIISNSIILEAGTYYIGYLDKNNTSNVEISLVRI